MANVKQRGAETTESCGSINRTVCEELKSSWMKWVKSAP